MLEILRHPAIIALQFFGRRSEGKHRRSIGKGHRLLCDDDRNDRGKAKLVYNPDEFIIKATAGYEPLYDIAKWLELQETLRGRAKCQAGIPRASDPAKYPLSCRVIDLTEDCCEVMYARTNGQRKIYVCGLYVKSGCAKCHNNTVDAEALLQVVMGVIRDVASGGAARETLIAELRSLAAAEQAAPEQNRASELAAVRAQIKELTKSIATCKRRMASEENDVVQAGYRDEFLRQTGELQVKEAELAELERLEAVKPAQLDPEAEVQLALAQLDRIEELLKSPVARNEIRGLVNDLGIWIGLNFVEAVKGKKRTVRRLAGGVITFGSDQPPVKLFGPRNAEPSPEGDKVDPRTGLPEDAMATRNAATTRSDLVAKQNAKRGSQAEYNTPSRDGLFSASTVVGQPSRQVSNPREGISSNKVNRGDMI